MAHQAARSICPKRPYAQRCSGSSNSGIHPRVGLDHARTGGRGRHNHSRPWAHTRCTHDRHQEVPVMVARGWSESKKRAYVIADNKLALNATWDEALLAGELADLRDLGADLNPDRFLGPGNRQHLCSYWWRPHRSRRRAGAAGRSSVHGWRCLGARSPSACVW